MGLVFTVGGLAMVMFARQITRQRLSGMFSATDLQAATGPLRRRIICWRVAGIALNVACGLIGIYAGISLLAA